MRPRAVLLVLLLAASCAPPPGSPEARGRARARTDIAGGDVRLRTQGFPCDSNSGLDPDTGLVRESDGCLGRSDDPELAAYNAEILRAARAGEVDRWLFRDRVRTKEQAVAAVARGVSIDEGAAVPLADGRFIAELSAFRRPAVPNAADGTLLAVRAADEAKARIELNTHGPVTLAVDPDSKTLFVRHDYGITTFDLATGVHLQYFHVSR